MSIANLFSDSIGSNQLNPLSIADWNAISGLAGGSVASVSNSDGNLNIAPTTGAVVCDLEDDVSIADTLTIGTVNPTGQFSFDSNGNLNLPLNSNTSGSTYIRAGDNSGTSTNTIDMFCNWDSTSGIYGGELFLSNSEAYIGINGVANSVTNYIAVNNTANLSCGTVDIQVSNPTSGATSTITMDTTQHTVSIPKCTLVMDNTTFADTGSFAIACFNSTTNNTQTMTFVNSSTLGGVGILNVPYITSPNFNINGSYTLPTTAGAAGTVLQCNGVGLPATWVAPASVGASYCCIYNIPGQNTGTNPSYPLILNTGTALKTGDYTVNANSITLQPNSIYKVDWSFSFIQFVALTVLFDIQSSTAGVVIAGTGCQINTSGQPMSGTGIITTGATASPTIQLIIGSTASTATYDINSICITKV